MECYHCIFSIPLAIVSGTTILPSYSIQLGSNKYPVTGPSMFVTFPSMFTPLRITFSTAVTSSIPTENSSSLPPELDISMQRVKFRKNNNLVRGLAHNKNWLTRLINGFHVTQSINTRFDSIVRTLNLKRKENEKTIIEKE